MIKEKFLRAVRRINPKSKAPEKDIRIFVVCFIVSLCFWLLNALSKTYTTSITYPVQYKEIPKDRIITSELPSEIDLRVSGFGFALLRLKLQINPTPIVFNISKLATPWISASADTTVTVSSIVLKKQLSHIISSEIDIDEIEPSSIYLRFEEIITKKVKVIPNIDISPKSQYILVDSIKCNPQWVTIKGPKSKVLKVDEIKTTAQSYTNVSKPISRIISLRTPEEIQSTPSEIKIEANIEQFTEGEMDVNIIPLNVPDSLRIFTFPKKIHITFTAPISKYKKIDKRTFQANITWDMIDVHNKMPIHVKAQNKMIHNFHFSPKEVDYIIQKKID
ncbi:YbbR-like domain-containing protein [Halosquirtibacter laminarini]|uniref:YbbR-like domain-containing protein n=1 Tax=Halosquirtibacter laminarini TaxID=3374600 RepID=A0AC61NMD3_9BACT|nr:YbbR-like domain-containing protein [Prolixibacteraceae bacterium]